MSGNDDAYFRRRAETEMDQARQAAHPSAAAAHMELAEAYLAKVATRQSSSKSA